MYALFSPPRSPNSQRPRSLQERTSHSHVRRLVWAAKADLLS